MNNDHRSDRSERSARVLLFLVLCAAVSGHWPPRRPEVEPTAGRRASTTGACPPSTVILRATDRGGRRHSCRRRRSCATFGMFSTSPRPWRWL